MKKDNLLDAICERAKINRYEADEALSAFVDHTVNALARGETVSLIGFGSFSVKRREARTGRNPQTGEAMHIAASNQAVFKAGKTLKDTVNT